MTEESPSAGADAVEQGQLELAGDLRSLGDVLVETGTGVLLDREVDLLFASLRLTLPLRLTTVIVHVFPTHCAI
jgi:hypothetical protein